MEWNDLPGHVSYVLIAVSYWATNILWLRITAVFGLFMEILYFRLSGGDLETGIYWDLVFLAINGYQLFRLYEEYRRASKLEGASELAAGAFAGMSRLQLSRLASLGEWRTFRSGDILTREGGALEELFYLASGDYEIEQSNTPIAKAGGGSFIGEMAYLTGAPASATVVAATSGRAFVFSSRDLKRMESSDEATAAALHLMLGKDLATKLRAYSAGSGDPYGSKVKNALA